MHAVLYLRSPGFSSCESVSAVHRFSHSNRDTEFWQLTDGNVMCKYLTLECDDLPGGFPNNPLLLEPSVAVPTLSLPVQHYREPGGTRVHHLRQGGRTR